MSFGETPQQSAERVATLSVWVRETVIASGGAHALRTHAPPRRAVLR